MADYIAPDAETVFLVSGGAKGITARCVTALAKRFKARFILVGRSSYDGEEPSWAHGIEGESALKQAAANDLRARGERPAPRGDSAGRWAGGLRAGRCDRRAGFA